MVPKEGVLTMDIENNPHLKMSRFAGSVITIEPGLTKLVIDGMCGSKPRTHFEVHGYVHNAFLEDMPELLRTPINLKHIRVTKWAAWKLKTK